MSDQPSLDPTQFRETLLDQKFFKLKWLWVQGVEVTQGVQRYRSHEHLTSASITAPTTA